LENPAFIAGLQRCGAGRFSAAGNSNQIVFVSIADTAIHGIRANQLARRLILLLAMIVQTDRESSFAIVGKLHYIETQLPTAETAVAEALKNELANSAISSSCAMPSASCM
jgi:hypothetical protein